MSKFATASQWTRINPDRRAPQTAVLTLSSRDGGDIIAEVNGTKLRKAVQ